MIRVRGKTESGQSITGDMDGTITEVATAVLEQADKAGDAVVTVTFKTLELAGKGIKIAPPRKRSPAEQSAKTATTPKAASKGKSK